MSDTRKPGKHKHDGAEGEGDPSKRFHVHEKRPQLLRKISQNDVQGHVWQIIFALAVLPFCPNLAAIGRCASSCHLMQDIVRDIEAKDPILQRWKVLLNLWKQGEHRRALDILVPIMMQCSPDANEAKIREGMRFKDERLDAWWMYACNLSALPDEIGILDFRGWLQLNHNQLESLPESFANIRVHSIDLSHNLLEYLPESSGYIRMPGALDLSHNLLKSLPTGFWHIRVGGSLWLRHNQLRSLPDFPEKFSHIPVLDPRNQLESLPDRYTNIICSLNLCHNQLGSLPESCGVITLKGDLDLRHNQLKSLPESFANITVERHINLEGNLLCFLPDNFDQINVGGKVHIDKGCKHKSFVCLKGKVKKVKPVMP